MPAHHLYEHQLAQFGEDAFAAGALVRRFHHCKTNELAEPACITALWVSGLDHGRQVLEKRIERPRIAGEEAADELGRGRPVAAVVDEERQLAGSGGVERVRCDRIGAHAGAARHDMRIAIGEDDDFAGFDRDRLPANDIGEASALGDHMISDQMIGTRQIFGRIISRGGCSATHGSLAATSKNAAPVSRTVLNKSDSASAAISASA